MVFGVVVNKGALGLEEEAGGEEGLDLIELCEDLRGGLEELLGGVDAEDEGH